MRNLFSRQLVRLSLAGLLLTAVSHAGLVYSAPPNQSGASDLDALLLADDFTVAAATTATQIKFWTLQSAPGDYTGSVNWAIYQDAGGVPGSSIASGNAAPSGVFIQNVATFGLDEYSYAFAVNASLNSGTYWVVLHNGSDNAVIPAGTFFWEWAADNGNSHYQDIALANNTWILNSSELALEVSGNVVPEPGPIVLLGTGLLGALALRARRRA